MVESMAASFAAPSRERARGWSVPGGAIHRRTRPKKTSKNILLFLHRLGDLLQPRAIRRPAHHEGDVILDPCE
jgi:hypothetical protein